MLFKKYSKLTPVIIIAIAILVSIVLFMSKPEPKVADKVSAPLLVNAIEAVKEDVRVSVRAQGTVLPRTTTTLIAEVAGRIVEVSETVKIGGYFKKGDVLLHIDQRDYLANVKRAEAAVAGAQSNFASEKGRSEVAYQDWVKYKGAVKRTEAATALALRKPQLEEAQAQLDSALADLDQARIQLDRTIIKAPYDGIFKSKGVDIGQYVNVGTVLADIFAIDKAELRLAVPSHKLDYLELPSLVETHDISGSTVRLYAEVGDTIQQWQASIVRTEGVFDERSRVLFAVAEIEDPYGIYHERRNELRMGTFVDAHIEGRVIEGLIALPRSLLRTGSRIWVIDKDQVIHNRKVSILRIDGPQVYVTAGLESGEMVCSSNFTGAIPGIKIRIAEKMLSTAFSTGVSKASEAGMNDRIPLKDNAS